MSPGKKRLRSRVFRLAALGVFLWLGVLTGRICATARTPPTTEPADVALVLGASARGGAPSPVFAARIDHAIDLFNAGKVRALLFTGGRSPGEPLADSQAARHYALARGVPAGAILVETTSRTTRENLSAARAVLAITPYKTCLLVSDPLHLFRALQMMKAEGIAGRPSPAARTRIRSLPHKLTFLAREVGFYHVYLLLGE